jgi:hypothetical protein
MYKERLDRAWKRVTTDWVEGTMELAIVLWEARQDCKADQSFSKWLDEQGYGELVISHQNRSGLINIGNPEHREIARKVLSSTRRFCWETIWTDEVKPLLVENGGLRQHRKPRAPKPTSNLTIARPPQSRKPSQQLTEGDMIRQLNKETGLKAWIEIGEAPVIGRMPDDTEEKVKEHLNEINARCVELFNISLYKDQMSEGTRRRLAVEFKGIKRWGEALAKSILGHNKLSRVEAPLCDIIVPFRKAEQ